MSSLAGAAPRKSSLEIKYAPVHTRPFRELDPKVLEYEGADKTLGVEYIEVNTNRVVAKLPITEKITQPLGLLHGGISVCFAESLASVGSQLFVDSDSFCLGLEINANHVSSGQVGDTVIGVATPLSIGKRAQVWDIKLSSEKTGKLISVIRCTTMVVSAAKKIEEMQRFGQEPRKYEAFLTKSQL